MIVFRSPRDVGRAMATVIVTALALVMASLTTQAALAHASTGDNTGAGQGVSVVDGGSLTTEQVRTSESAGAAVVNFWKSPPAGCSGYWTFAPFGKTGKFPCSTDINGVYWPDGHLEYFGIGTNWQVYRTTSSANGWQSMGGTATNTWQAYINGNGYPTIAVFNVNASHMIWCKQYISPSWQGWYACGPY
jgi:hypothetical protein